METFSLAQIVFAIEELSRMATPYVNKPTPLERSALHIGIRALQNERDKWYAENSHGRPAVDGESQEDSSPQEGRATTDASSDSESEVI